MIDIDPKAFYYLLHREACSRAQSDGILDRFCVAHSGVKEFDGDKYLNLFREYSVEPESGLSFILRMLYDMGWNQTDHNLATRELLKEHGLDERRRITIPSDVAMFIICAGCDRKVYQQQEETYTDYLDDDAELHYCHDCVPEHVYVAAVERAKRKGYIHLPPEKVFS